MSMKSVPVFGRILGSVWPHAAARLARVLATRPARARGERPKWAT